MTCSFDSGLCDFRQDTTDGTDWTRSEETTPTPLTGPDSDHTTGKGESARGAGHQGAGHRAQGTGHWVHDPQGTPGPSKQFTA